MFKTVLFSISIILLLTGFTVLPNGTGEDLLTPSLTTEETSMQISLEPCEYQPGKKKTFEAECGTLTVPERWDDPESKTITLPLVRIPATGAEPQEPIFWLQGGPGYSNLSWSPPDWLLEDHDIIQVGYRGVDGSSVLDCPDLTKLINKSVGQGVFTSETQEKFSLAAQGCAQKLEDEGIDLNAFTVLNVVKDLEAARVALGHEKINIYSVSYGTRVAQIFAYQFPESLHRVVMIGLNTPGHFIYDPEEFDEMIKRMSELCQSDPQCAADGSNLAETIYTVNHQMPDHWWFFPIDPGTVRLGTHMMFFSTKNMATPIDMYQRAAKGDPSGLAMMTLMAKYVFPPFTWGDLVNKGSNLDAGDYQGQEPISLGDSILGAPLSELIWQIAGDWPVELEDEYYRQLHETNVSILVANGTLDFSTPPSALVEAKDYWQNAQFVLLSEFSHVDDVEKLQPEAFQQMITSYYATGTADSSGFVYQPIEFKAGMSLTTMAKLILAATLLIPPLLLIGLFFAIRRMLRKKR